MRTSYVPTDTHQHDQTIYGNYSLPIEIFTIELTHPNSDFVGLHWHEEFQISFVIKGELIFFVRNRNYIVHEGEGIFINSKEPHMIQPKDGTNCIYHGINFAGRLIYGFEQSTIYNKYFLPLATKNHLPVIIIKPDGDIGKNILFNTTNIIHTFQNQVYGWEIDVSINLLTIWKDLLNYSMPDQAKENNYIPIEVESNYRLKYILDYIHQHYSDKISLDHISDSIHICKNECCRLFKKYMGCTIFDYLTNYRLIKSQELLSSTQLSISDIAFECGFGSSSYFIDKFKKKVGYTPHSYRQKLKNLSNTPNSNNL